ncbi:MAG: enoyl-CoA hydratase [Boseongicola sp.]|nr:enoyl-CoA hydratase [Boseongicola sp.]
MSEDILLEFHEGAVTRLVLNRPAARNSLSLAMLDELTDAITRLGGEPEVHVIVIAANGPVFCAGHDLKELTAARTQPDRGKAFFERAMGKCVRLMMSIVRCPKPVIAEVHGIATAAGCQLVSTCDLAVAADDAQFATPGVNIGLFCSTPMVALTRNVGRKSAMRMLLTGDMVRAEEAQAMGLVSDVAASNDLTETTMALAGRIAAKSPATLKVGKETFYAQVEMPLPEAYGFAADVMVLNMLEPDALEGIAAFFDRRAPHWRPL